ncbi:L-serine ammonia-lyase [Helicobacter mustelae]|uniref:L-serine dehydratase n=1 Tax=Helicobacter mustelae (strain ATCC 43772 / CCUG 25715 / CIP 103759 / LMG 18044 / NCTC 12198 / R85-136P) TaxID=679897 RepID=D3UGA9_HELM1|nr:L-serine ammonia-lyase [Helicobacter mustelae]CBG39530.1 L-serine deaminase 1 [Helicobacter mustelae 12198]SQH71042.1 L-serine deaminase 1 [Helicobacter mustelae]
MISILEIYKIGIGPSSSHTMGPMKIAKNFVDALIGAGLLEKATRIIADVYGSLSLTGRGHQTDIAIILGLAGNTADNVDIDATQEFLKNLRETKTLQIYGEKFSLDFEEERDILFHKEFLKLHENGLRLSAFAGERELLSKTYYSVGGGRIVEERDFGQENVNRISVPYPFSSAKELLEHCDETSLSISSIVLENELVSHSMEEIQQYFDRIYSTMKACMHRGFEKEGLLPGCLKVPRRAAFLHRELIANKANQEDPMRIFDWVNLFALAISEENASGGRIVTAPTNGACGIVPAVLFYYDHFIEKLTQDVYLRYFATSAAIGLLYEMNASISGAEVGCQGEVGVACSMAAAGLAELLGGNARQVCMAAEIGMEHNLGLTCDPVAGLVQIPCIERNAIASIKAINAARMAILRKNSARVSLDEVIATMYRTGRDLNSKYKETSQGGLAFTLNNCG